MASRISSEGISARIDTHVGLTHVRNTSRTKRCSSIRNTFHYPIQCTSFSDRTSFKGIRTSNSFESPPWFLGWKAHIAELTASEINFLYNLPLTPKRLLQSSALFDYPPLRLQQVVTPLANLPRALFPACRSPDGRFHAQRRLWLHVTSEIKVLSCFLRNFQDKSCKSDFIILDLISFAFAQETPSCARLSVFSLF